MEPEFPAPCEDEQGKKLGEDESKTPCDNPIFLNPQPAPKAKPDKPKTKHRKKGRQRTKEKVRRLFVLYRIPYGYWPVDLDYEMCLYYTVNYIRKDGESHDIFLQWKAEAESLWGKKFRVNPKIRPEIPRSRSKVLPFPDDRAASER